MTIVLVTLAIIIAATLIWLAALDGTFHVRRATIIGVEPEQAYNVVRDFHHWPAWSPWLIHEPEAQLTFSSAPDEPTGWYSWNGRHIGAGTLTHVAMVAPAETRQGRIEQRLGFTRPFKSDARVVWDFTTVQGGVEISWAMYGRMPFLFRFLAPMTARMLERDFELGLALLSGMLDPGGDAPHISFEGIAPFPARQCITLPFAGDTATRRQTITEGIERLSARRRDLGVTSDEPVFTAYHKVDTERPWFDGVVAAPLADTALSAPSGSADDHRAQTLGGEGRWYRVRMRGGFRFMEMTWHCAIAHLRLHKIALDGRRDCFEVYVSRPDNGHNGRSETDLYIPIKA
ncbi:MAG: SRPBCC family protein [Gammaproteobacteria bacterium]